MSAPAKARRGYPEETPESARESTAKLCNCHLTYPLRSNTVMTVVEHRKILESIRDTALGGGVML